jgi:hypothetical protein
MKWPPWCLQAGTEAVGVTLVVYVQIRETVLVEVVVVAV